jgi:hypothetical protein
VGGDAVPLKRNFDGEYVRRKLQSGAQKLMADQAELRQQELSGAAKEADDAPDVIVVAQKPAAPYPHDPLQEPRVQWESMGTMPFGCPPIVVTCSHTEALRNRQSLRELLERRVRRMYRAHLLAAKRMPDADALTRAMRLRVFVADVSLIAKPGE